MNRQTQERSVSALSFLAYFTIGYWWKWTLPLIAAWLLLDAWDDARRWLTGRA